jgi:hypothetical protein
MNMLLRVSLNLMRRRAYNAWAAAAWAVFPGKVRSFRPEISLRLLVMPHQAARKRRALATSGGWGGERFSFFDHKGDDKLFRLIAGVMQTMRFAAFDCPRVAGLDCPLGFTCYRQGSFARNQVSHLHAGVSVTGDICLRSNRNGKRFGYVLGAGKIEFLEVCPGNRALLRP